MDESSWEVALRALVPWCEIIAALATSATNPKQSLRRLMAKNLNWWTRKAHRWGAVACAAPLLLVIGTGMLLQLKKQLAWVQPPTRSGERANVPQQRWPGILSAARSVPEAEVKSWADIDRLDVRPARGIVKVRCNNRWELQIDLATGAVVSSAFRRSDLIESLHDGSFFSGWAKLWIFLPCGIILMGLWITGAWLWYLPFGIRRKKRLNTSEA